MPQVASGEVQLAYTTFGEREQPPILLVHGFGEQLVQWEFSGLAEALAELGFFVAAYDQRDCGESTHIDDWTPPGLSDLRRFAREGTTIDPPYSVDDLGRDLLAVVDALGLQSPVVLGASAGAATAAAAATLAPEALSMVITYGAIPGGRYWLDDLPPGAESVFEEICTHRYVSAHLVEALHWLQWVQSSPEHPIDLAHARAKAATMLDRGYSPKANLRMLCALLTSASPAGRDTSIPCPTLAIHGTEDQIAPSSFSQEIVAKSSSGEMRPLDGAGHALAPSLAPLIATEIANATSQRNVAPHGA